MGGGGPRAGGGSQMHKTLQKRRGGTTRYSSSGLREKDSPDCYDVSTAHNTFADRNYSGRSAGVEISVESKTGGGTTKGLCQGSYLSKIAQSLLTQLTTQKVLSSPWSWQMILMLTALGE